MKVIAKIKNGEEIVEVRLQRMFPNCEFRYNKCCKDDKEFWEKYEKQIKALKPNKQPFRWKPAQTHTIEHAPEGFKGW